MHYKTYILIVLFSICSYVGEAHSDNSSQYIRTTYYAQKFHNRKTASGEIYRKEKYTAAHKSLPFGTFLRIINESNNKEVVVKVNDRMSKRAKANLDLSRAAANQLDFIREGVKKLKVIIITPEEAANHGHPDAEAMILKK